MNSFSASHLLRDMGRPKSSLFSYWGSSCLPAPAAINTAAMDSHPLEPRVQTNSLFYTLPWSWCSITATEKRLTWKWPVSLHNEAIQRQCGLSRAGIGKAFEALQVKWSSLQICDFALCLSSSRRQCVNNVLCLNPQARIHIVIICTMFSSLCLLHNNIIC